MLCPRRTLCVSRTLDRYKFKMQNPSQFCTKCGRPLDAEANFCANCGTPTGNAAAHKRTPFVYSRVGVFILIFLVLGALALPFLYKSPEFSRRAKIILAIVAIVYTIVMIIYAYQTLSVELSSLQVDLKGL
jgi:uncharacterized membrane protein YvbJ